jgi:sulfate transport system ATP-binding protein
MEIRIRHLTKSFGASPAVHDVSLDIRSGELLGLLGPSGSGKTTLLRMIAGLEIPNEGRIFFGDEDASFKSVQERRVGFVFQSYALFRHMNVADNISYGLRVRPRAQRPAPGEIGKRVNDLLEMMQLGGFGSRYPAQLSGGQRQRVALARALAVEPRVLLLDEPFGALDAQVRKDLRRWLREIHDRTGHTTIFVTHDQDEALELSDRVAILSKGKVEQIGSPQDVYHAPQTPFVHGFIGESNRLDVRIARGRATFQGVDLGVASQGYADGPATFFFRPQNAALQGAGDSPLRGTFRAIHRTGALTRVTVALAGDVLVDVDASRDIPFRPGDTVSVRIDEFRVFGEADTAARPVLAA